MTSRLTPKPRVPLTSSVAATGVALALTAAGCSSPPMPPPDAFSAPMVDGGNPELIDAYVPPPMPPPLDAGDLPDSAPMPHDTGTVPMVDGALPPVDAAELPPMPPPMPDPGDPDSGVIPPMPPPMPPPPMPAPKP